MSPAPTEEGILDSVAAHLRPALREIIDAVLAGLPEEERAAALAKLEEKLFDVIGTHLVPGFLLGIKGAVADFLRTGHGPTGTSHGHHAAG